jgi:signal transduction histidine kinase
MVDAYIARGRIYFKLRNHQKSIQEYSLAIKLAERVNYQEGKAIAIGRIGGNQYMLMNLPEAEKNITQAIEIDKNLKSKDLKILVEMYAMQGVIKRELGKYSESIAAFEEGIKIGEKLADQKAMMGIYSSYANSLDMVSQYEKSIEQHLKAIKLADYYKDTVRLMSEYNNIAMVFHHINEYEKSEAYYDKSFEIGLKKKDYKIMGHATLNKAMLYKLRGNYQKSDSLNIQSVEYFNKANDPNGKALAYNNYGNSLVAQKKYKKAEENLLKALEIREKSGSKAWIARTLSVLAKLMIETNRLDEAENYLNQIKTIYAEIGSNDQDQNNLNRHLKNLYLAKKDYKKAFEYQQKEMETTSKLFDESEKVNALKLQTEYELKKKDETLELEKENQHRKQLYFFSIGGFIVLLLLLGLLILVQRRKRARERHQSELVQIRQQHRLSLADSLANAEQEERKKIANKLHDETGGILSIAKLNIDQLEENVFVAGSDADQKLKATKKLLTEASESIRGISHSLMPVALDKYGLKAGISELVNAINTSGKIKIEEIIEGLDDTKSWSPQLNLTIYRMVQEVFNNIIKHSRATNVLLQIVEFEDTVTVYIEDNGKGMDENSNSDGIGMKMLKQNIEYLNGKVEINGKENKGTFVLAELPIS